MKKSKWLAAAAAAAALAISLAACASLDIVGNVSVASFQTLLNTIPNKVKADDLNAGWAISAPDDSVRFLWSADHSRAPHDVVLEFSAQPFLAAGLVPEQLPGNYAFYTSGATGELGTGNPMLTVGKKFGGSDKVTGASTALAAYELIVNKHREAINYHTALDHFGVKLGDGNMFEWAKDMKINGYDNSNQDKDIVFVLNPEPLIQAGVAPEKVAGWVYTQVSMEENGKTIQVWKFLKAFNLT
jgi:hypothetical protein